MHGHITDHDDIAFLYMGLEELDPFVYHPLKSDIFIAMSEINKILPQTEQK